MYVQQKFGKTIKKFLIHFILPNFCCTYLYIQWFFIVSKITTGTWNPDTRPATIITLCQDCIPKKISLFAVT